jgi:CRP-like cAMP-binding protein
MQLDSSAFVADPEFIHTLQLLGTSVPCDQDRVIFRQGDTPAGVYILLKGAASLSTELVSQHSVATDRFVITVETSAGAVLGLPGVLGSAENSVTAIVHSGAQLGFIARDDFASAMKADPLLSLKVLQALAKEVGCARQAALQQLYVTAECGVPHSFGSELHHIAAETAHGLASNGPRKRHDCRFSPENRIKANPWQDKPAARCSWNGERCPMNEWENALFMTKS